MTTARAPIACTRVHVRVPLYFQSSLKSWVQELSNGIWHSHITTLPSKRNASLVGGPGKEARKKYRQRSIRVNQVLHFFWRGVYYRHVIILLENSWTALYNPDGKNRVPLHLGNGRRLVTTWTLRQDSIIIVFGIPAQWRFAAATDIHSRVW